MIRVISNSVLELGLILELAYLPSSKFKLGIPLLPNVNVELWINIIRIGGIPKFWKWYFNKATN